jgi:hypothetical protein
MSRRNGGNQAVSPIASPDKQHALDLAVVEINLYHGGATIYALHEMAYLGIFHSKRGLALHATDIAQSPRVTTEQLKDFKMHKLITELTIDSAKGAADAAALIYAHAVLDAMLHKLCTVSANVDPRMWVKLIDEKPVSLRELRATALPEIEQKLLRQYLARLDRESLLTKCDLLLRAMQPPSLRGVLKGFTYSRERLLKIDQLRHDLVHKLAFHRKSKQPMAKVRYLFNTGHFFHNLLAIRYKLHTIQTLPARSR